MHVMLLTAGLGTRLHPLTNTIPKQLLPLNAEGHCLLKHHLETLEQAGYQAVTLNVSAFAEAIQAYLKTHPTQMNITVIEEGMIPLGPAPGIANALSTLGDATFLLVSSDVYTTHDLRTYSTLEVEYAHLVLIKNPGGPSDFRCDKGTLFADTPDGLYANIALCHPRLWCHPLTGHYSFGEMIRWHLKEGHTITAEYTNALWHNLNTVEDYNQLCKYFD